MEALSFLSGAGFASSAKYFDIRYNPERPPPCWEGHH
jgi:hypothetical protein